MQESIDFLAPRKTDAIRRSQFATSEGALQLWVLLSQDEEHFAHEVQSAHAARSAHGARLEAEVHSADEAQAAHARSSPDGKQAAHELRLACWTQFADELP